MTSARRCALLAMAALSLSAGAAGAFPLRVVAATELRAEPRVSGDRRSLRVALHLHDDRGAPAARRTLRVELSTEVSVAEVRTVTTDALGDAEVVFALPATAHRASIAARFEGARGAAASHATLSVDLDAPFVTTDLALPPEGVELGRGLEAVITARVGAVLARSPGGFSVDLVATEMDGRRQRVLAAGVTDASGRCPLRVGPGELPSPGIHRLVPRVQVGVAVIEGTARALLVRAPTTLLLRRSDDDPLLLSGVLSRRAGGVVGDAPVRVVRGDRTLAAARTDARGTFVVRLDPGLAAEPDLVVRALFEPTEPWYTPSESDAVALTPPAPRTIAWQWSLAPLAAALLVIAAARLRRRGAVTPGAVQAPASPSEERVEWRPPSSPRGLVVRWAVFDVATAGGVEGVELRWAGGDWQTLTAEGVSLEGTRRMDFELRAPGFAPRTVAGEFPRPGEYTLRVGMRTWREALFEVLRPWLRGAGRGTALPTPREALAAAPPTWGAKLVGMVERGSYGPEAPDQASLEEAERLATLIGGETSRSIDAAAGEPRGPRSVT